jgi:hypothetical protein
MIDYKFKKWQNVIWCTYWPIEIDNVLKVEWYVLVGWKVFLRWVNKKWQTEIAPEEDFVLIDDFTDNQINYYIKELKKLNKILNWANGNFIKRDYISYNIKRNDC